jgi:hypothetical protein
MPSFITFHPKVFHEENIFSHLKTLIFFFSNELMTSQSKQGEIDAFFKNSFGKFLLVGIFDFQ